MDLCSGHQYTNAYPKAVSVILTFGTAAGDRVVVLLFFPPFLPKVYYIKIFYVCLHGCTLTPQTICGD